MSHVHFGVSFFKEREEDQKSQEVTVQILAVTLIDAVGSRVPIWLHSQAPAWTTFEGHLHCGSAMLDARQERKPQRCLKGGWAKGQRPLQ
jgi:hypothetical protein